MEKMNRPRRMRIVVGIGLGLVSLFIAYVGSPLVAWLLWPSVGATGEMNSSDLMMGAFERASQVAANSQQVSLFAFLFAAMCFAYVLVDIAIWFVGPPESSDGSAE